MKNFPLFRRAALVVRATLPFVVATLTGVARADVVFAWNELLLHVSTSSTADLAPHLEARLCAMTHLAIQEAIAAAPADPRGVATADAQRAAAVWAARTVLTTLLPTSAPSVDALAERHLAAIQDGPEKTRGGVAGRAAAARILQEREGDGWTELVLLHPPAGPFPDTSEVAAATLVRGDRLPPSPWLRARPFALKTAEHFRVTEVRTLERNGEVWVAHHLSNTRWFKNVDRSRPFEDAERWWAQPPLVAWNRIARQMASSQPRFDLAQQAKLLATLNVALADATLAVLNARHTVGSWRIMTTEAWTPLNGEPPLSSELLRPATDGFQSDFARLVVRRVLIPPTPNYPSLAAAAAGAAEEALAIGFGSERIGFALPQSANDTNASNGDGGRTYPNVATAARECAFASSLDGRHTREACVAGYQLGSVIGRYAGKRALTARR